MRLARERRRHELAAEEAEHVAVPRVASGDPDALAPGQKPLVVTFATPALCTSATCGPELDAVLALQQSYGERANFIHVEIYQYPFDGSKVAAAVDEWKLPSDPWTFVLDRTGIVRDRLEGAAPAEEMEPALKTLLT